ncbi:hypothetical protein [Mycolicibacterium goodii]|uniref:hypothetical protein n=1 Tax=Mycolicibacterium goodii TaxID=134601 RepID=UPI0027DF39BF|nr:hypothetical protein [Mycolicibacterium goodii]
MTQAGGDILEQDLAFLGAVELEFHDLERLVHPEAHSGFGFHLEQVLSRIRGVKRK